MSSRVYCRIQYMCENGRRAHRLYYSMGLEVFYAPCFFFLQKFLHPLSLPYKIITQCMLVNTNQTLIYINGCDVAQWLVSNIDMKTKSSS